MFMFPYLTRHIPLTKKMHLKIFGLLGLHCVIYTALYLLSFKIRSYTSVDIFSWLLFIPTFVLYIGVFLGTQMLKLLLLEEVDTIKKYGYFLATVPLFFAFYLSSAHCRLADNIIVPIFDNALPAVQTLALILATYFMAWTWEYQFHIRSVLPTKSLSSLLELAIFRTLMIVVIVWLLFIVPVNYTNNFFYFFCRSFSTFSLFQSFKILHARLYVDPWMYAFDLTINAYLIFQSF